jgi:hypothetical protein
MRVFIAAVALLAAMEVQAGGKCGRGGHKHGGSSACGTASGGCANGMGGGGCASGFCGMVGCNGGAVACATCGVGGAPCPNGLCPIPQTATIAPQSMLQPIPADPSFDVKVKRNGEVKAKNRSKFHAMDKMNARRSSMGLYAYVEDPALQAAAEACVQFKAQNCLSGHTGNDFAFLPAGASAKAAGADGSPQSPYDPFLACCE